MANNWSWVLMAVRFPERKSAAKDGTVERRFGLSECVKL